MFHMYRLSRLTKMRILSNCGVDDFSEETPYYDLLFFIIIIILLFIILYM